MVFLGESRCTRSSLFGGVIGEGRAPGIVLFDGLWGMGRDRPATALCMTVFTGEQARIQEFTLVGAPWQRLH